MSSVGRMDEGTLELRVLEDSLEVCCTGAGSARGGSRDSVG